MLRRLTTFWEKISMVILKTLPDSWRSVLERIAAKLIDCRAVIAGERFVICCLGQRAGSRISIFSFWLRAETQSRTSPTYTVSRRVGGMSIIQLGLMRAGLSGGGQSLG